MKKCIALEGESGFFNSVGKLGLCCNDASHGYREDHFILDYNSRKDYLKSKNYTWDDFSFCDFCKQNEDKGYLSTRQIISQKNNRFELTISVGNVCNLRCAMCRPDLSYLLSQDITALPYDLYSQYLVPRAEKFSLTSQNRDNIEKFISTIDKQIEINVLGGEPLIDNEIVEWFSNLINKFSHIYSLQITTNLTYNTKKTMQLCENPKVRIGASIEGYEDSYEWGRFGMKWDNVVKNLLNFQSVVGHRMHVHSTIHAISILGDKNLSNLLNENNIKYDKALLFSPPFLHLKVLNEKERNILELHDVEQQDMILRNQFVSYMLSLEKSRKCSMPKSISTFFGINRDN